MFLLYFRNLKESITIPFTHCLSKWSEFLQPGNVSVNINIVAEFEFYLCTEERCPDFITRLLFFHWKQKVKLKKIHTKKIFRYLTRNESKMYKNDDHKLCIFNLKYFISLSQQSLSLRRESERYF